MQNFIGQRDLDGGTLKFGDTQADGTRFEQFTPSPPPAPRFNDQGQIRSGGRYVDTQNNRQNAPTPTVREAYGGLIPDQGNESAFSDFGDILREQAKPVNEAEIRRNTLERFQSEIDALNRVYAEKKSDEVLAGRGRSGQNNAIQSRRGLIGSDFGASQKNKVSQYNQSIQNAISSEQAYKIGAILSEARTSAASEFEAKTAARKQGAQEYIQFLSDSAARKTQRVSDTVRNALLSGVEANDDFFTELSSLLGTPVEQIKATYNEQKGAQDAAALQAEKDNFVKPETFNVGGVLYERNEQGELVAVTPAKEETFSGIVGEYEFYRKQEEDAGREPLSFNDYQDIDANRKVKRSGGGSPGVTIFDPSAPTQTIIPSAPKQSFVEFLAGKEEEAGQSLSQEARDELRKEFDQQNTVPTPDAQNADLSNYSYQVQQAIKGKVSVESLLTGGSAGERANYAKQLQQAEANGLLESSNVDKLYGGLGRASQTAVRSRVIKYSSEPIVQNFATIQEGFNFASSIADETENPADDQALIYSLAKALDPGSVVREGEYATAQKYAQSWVKAYGKGVTQALFGTGFLSLEARKNIKKTIKQKYNSSLRGYNNINEQYTSSINAITGRDNGGDFLINYVTPVASQNITVSNGSASDILSKWGVK